MNPKVGEDGRYEVVRVLDDGEERRLPDHIRGLVLRRDRCRCVWCGHDGRLEVDHIVPWSAGGSDDMDNLRTLCHRCNQNRSNFRVPADDDRRLPNGFECVYCQRHLLGEPDVTTIYCIQCNKKAPGIPNDPSWHPDVDRPAPPTPWFVTGAIGLDVPEEDPIPPAVLEQQYRAALVAYQRAAAPPAPMPEDEEEVL